MKNVTKTADVSAYSDKEIALMLNTPKIVQVIVVIDELLKKTGLQNMNSAANMMSFETTGDSLRKDIHKYIEAAGIQLADLGITK